MLQHIRQRSGSQQQGKYGEKQCKQCQQQPAAPPFSIRIREELVEKINQISAQSGYSRNELIARFLEYAADRCVVEDK